MTDSHSHADEIQKEISEEISEEISDISQQLPDMSEPIENDSEGVENPDSLLNQENDLSSTETLNSTDIIERLDTLIEMTNQQNLHVNNVINFSLSLIGVFVLYFVGRLLYKFINNILLGGI